MARAQTAAQVRKAAIASRKGKRKDPQSRHIDGGANWTKLRGRDPSLHYVLAYEGDQDTGAQYYADMGYKEVEYDEEGVQFGAGRVENVKGASMRMKGHVLMALPKADHDEIVQYGDDGQTGQEMADEIDKKILKKGGVDSLRGLIGSYADAGMTLKVAED